MLRQCLVNQVPLISIDDMYSQEYKAALYHSQKYSDYTQLTDIAQKCIKRLDVKCEFLIQTIQYIKDDYEALLGSQSQQEDNE